MTNFEKWIWNNCRHLFDKYLIDNINSVEHCDECKAKYNCKCGVMGYSGGGCYAAWQKYGQEESNE